MEPEIIYQDRYLWMDILSREVRVDGFTVNLSATEWKVLAKLIWASGRVISGLDFHWEPSTLRYHVKHLREKLGFSAKAPIVAVWRAGYRYDRLIGVER